MSYDESSIITFEEHQILNAIHKAMPDAPPLEEIEWYFLRHGKSFDQLLCSMKYAHCYNIGLVEYAKKQFFQALQKHGD